MRKLAFCCVALALSACGGEDDPPPVTNACTAAELGSTKCEATNLLECNGTQWNLKENCATTSKICKAVPGLAGVSRCEAPVTPAAEGETCTSDAGCESGLVCSTNSIFGMTAGLQSEVCIDECTGNADCDAGTEYCEDTGYADQNFCWTKSTEEGGGCLSDAGCPAGLSCGIVIGLAGQCLEDCDGATVNTPSDCTSPKTCLTGPGWDPELTGDNPKACPNGNECTTASGFTCEQFSDGKFCVKPNGICGSASPIVTNFTPTALEGLVDDFATNGTQTLCNIPNESWYCGLPASGNAEVECAQLNSGFRYQDEGGDPFECEYNPSSQAFNFDCALIGGECINWTSGAACGFIASVCVAFCETDEGVAITGACPGGQTCGAPTDADVNIGYPIVQGGATPVSCTTPGSATGCDGVNGFACVGFSDGNYCARNRKVCGITL